MGTVPTGPRETEGERRVPLGGETPVEEMGPVPGWLLLVYGSLVVWALVYLFVNWWPGRTG